MYFYDTCVFLSQNVAFPQYTKWNRKNDTNEPIRPHWKGSEEFSVRKIWDNGWMGRHPVTWYCALSYNTLALTWGRHKEIHLNNFAQTLPPSDWPKPFSSDNQEMDETCSTLNKILMLLQSSKSPPLKF